MAGAAKQVLDWLDDRTGWRAGRKHLLDEPLPGGTGWWFVTGSVLMFLLAVQLLTGIVLTMYYVPAPEHAYDSVRFIMDRLTFGPIVRGLHFFGASFIVVAAVVHMLRVVLFGSYKKPREVTWITGVVLLLIILAFSLSGYLLPWDQKAYWATTVTINIARSGPLGEFIGGVLRGGSELGALTLLRWYTAHVILLPAALVGFVVAHIFLMRRHGISGPITPVAAPAKPFYPYHAVKDTLAMALVFAALLTFAVMIPAPLDAIADPSDATYIPRPEWYFLSLFELLKYFPGPLEPIATVVIPGLVVGSLLLLPFLDRGAQRQPLRRPLVLGWFAILGVAVVTLTYRGLADSPNNPEPDEWGPLAIAGAEFVKDERCATCHVTGGAANPLAMTRLSRDPEWLTTHVADPQIIAPGLREAPGGGMSGSQALSILSYMRKTRAGGDPPPPGPDHTAIMVYGQYCARCHMLDGEGGSSGPDLTRAAERRDGQFLRDWISDPEAIDEFANMPAFGEQLSEEQMDAIVAYLAVRK
jgi:ubiquinol-cytochrome c reductase cytochrome b subunit